MKFHQTTLKDAMLIDLERRGRVARSSETWSIAA